MNCLHCAVMGRQYKLLAEIFPAALYSALGDKLFVNFSFTVSNENVHMWQLVTQASHGDSQFSAPWSCA